jgi:FdhD protein
MTIDATRKVAITRLAGGTRARTLDEVVTEYPLTIVLNGREVVTLICTPTDMRYLAAGYLFSEGLVAGKDNIEEIVIAEAEGAARVTARSARAPSSRRMIASGGGRGALSPSPAPAGVTSNVTISEAAVFALVDEFVQRSKLFQATGGVHCAALCDTNSILVFHEDIGRHNAIDKVLGQCLLEDIPTAGRLLITSGRVSSEILLKVARRDIPLIISKSAPTAAGVTLAGELGMTLVGFTRGRKANIYTNEWRVSGGG